MTIVPRAILILLLHPVIVAGAPVGEAAKLIERLQMQKIPDEGAWFALTYRSDDTLPTNAIERYQNVPHVAGSAIYGLVTREDFSAMHVLQTDEIWHYYAGAPLELLLLHPDGHGEIVVLGPDVLKGQRPQVVVPRDVWQGARPLGGADGYTLFGCTLAPGFEYGDFAIGYRDQLQQAYPKFAAQIASLTRTEFARKPATAAQALPATVRHDVFLASDVVTIDIAKSIALKELAGRKARIHSDAYSIAQFTLVPGAAMPESRNKTAEEVFLVTSGSGEVTLDGQSRGIRPGSVVLMKAGVVHSIRAMGELPLVFYAISSPAFSPDDYVLEP